MDGRASRKVARGFAPISANLTPLIDLSFLLVIFAWYGVNFWLGAGLHSYGFSSGGNVQIFTYIAIQCAFVAYAIFVYRRANAR